MLLLAWYDFIVNVLGQSKNHLDTEFSMFIWYVQPPHPILKGACSHRHRANNASGVR